MVYQLYDSAFRILDIRNNLLENFTGSRKQIIDLAASTIPSSYLLPELLAGFGRMYPDVYFHSWQTDSSGAINRVLDGTVDLALTILPQDLRCFVVMVLFRCGQEEKKDM